MERTSLYEEHIALNGKLVDFAGWELPVQYTSIIEEHLAARSKAALFDVSHMGEITVKGKNAEQYMRKMIPTSLDRLEPGRCMYSCLCNDRGGVIDDLFVYMIGLDDFLLVVNASTTEKDMRWLTSHVEGEVEVENISGLISKIDIQGPFSRQILSDIITEEGFAGLERFQFMHATYDSRPIIVSCSGYTGEPGYELYMHNDCAPVLWRDLFEKGKNFGMLPAGLGARDTLRLEMCYSLYGHELNEETTPYESGIGWLVNSRDEYIGKKALADQKKHGVPREIVYLEVIDRGIPREKFPVRIGDTVIGMTTSGGYSPSMKKGIAIAIVTKGMLALDSECDIIIRENPCRAISVRKPFLKNESSDT